MYPSSVLVRFVEIFFVLSSSCQIYNFDGNTKNISKIPTNILIKDTRKKTLGSFIDPLKHEEEENFVQIVDSNVPKKVSLLLLTYPWIGFHPILNFIYLINKEEIVMTHNFQFLFNENIYC